MDYFERGALGVTFLALHHTPTEIYLHIYYTMTSIALESRKGCDDIRFVSQNVFYIFKVLMENAYQYNHSDYSCIDREK